MCVERYCENSRRGMLAKPLPAAPIIHIKSALLLVSGPPGRSSYDTLPEFLSPVPLNAVHCGF